jgi:exopolysaccharide biosynthesis protein
MLDTFSMVKEISVMEQRYQAVLAVNSSGFSSDIDVSGVLFRWLLRI